MNTKKLGSIIRENRVGQKLRQAELAAATGVGLRFLIELEAGKPTAQLGKALAVLDALGCRVVIDCSPTPGKRQ